MVLPGFSLESLPILVKGCLLRKHSIVVSSIVLMLLSLIPGCGHKPPSGVINSEIVVPAKAKTALVVIAPTRMEKLPSANLPENIGGGIVGGAAFGAYLGLSFLPYSIPATPALVVLGATGGAVYGAIDWVISISEISSLKEAETLLQKIIYESKFEKGLAEDIVSYAAVHGYEIDNFSESILTNSEETIPNFNFISERYWAVLEILDISVSLSPMEIGSTPYSQFVIQTHVRLTRTSDHSVLVDQKVTYDRGSTRPLEWWLKDEAFYFRVEIPYARKHFSETIVDEIYLKNSKQYLYQFWGRDIQDNMK